MRKHLELIALIVTAVVESPRALGSAHVVPRLDERIAVREEDVAEVVAFARDAGRRIVRRALRGRVVRLGGVQPQSHDGLPVRRTHGDCAVAAHHRRHVGAVKRHGDDGAVRHADLGRRISCQRRRRDGSVLKRQEVRRGTRRIEEAGETRHIHRAVGSRHEHVRHAGLDHRPGVRGQRPFLEHKPHAPAVAQTRTGVHFSNDDRSFGRRAVLEDE